ncbi:MAG TPA: hypothetical protein ENH62_12565 [Marinobacter sp.]|uniref:Uncharacterized protein n=1 Tax=marine sediment metagenome TaxID=412755 RepID=A0A0F9KQF2_9ZZZZ|nr:hypothetical protein [Marinobacter sp.]|tara:strand:+ start:394 stop:1215 length:822 start_codon:yes stop_codon:yes gene_type:complete
MPQIDCSEEEWLDLYIVQIQFPDWTMELNHAYLEALHSLSRIFGDAESAHEQVCKTLKNGRNPSNRRGNYPPEIINNPILKNNRGRALQRKISAILKHQEDVQLRPLVIKRRTVTQALSNINIETDLSLTKYADWLRYAYWTDEEAVEFALRSKKGLEFDELLKKVKNEVMFRNDYGDILPIKFVEWVRVYSRKVVFNKDDLEQMGPDRLDTLKVIRRKKIYALLLALIEKHYEDAINKEKRLSDLCELYRDRESVTRDTIVAILQEANDVLS